MRFASLLVLAVALALPAGAFGKDTIAGPVAASTLRAVDGDTLEVTAQIWLGLEISTAVRIRGIDAPEMRAKCPHEKQQAVAATAKLAEIAAGRVRLRNIENDKYGGRVIADVTAEGGREIADLMLESGLVRPYEGGERQPWCGVASLGG